VKAFTPEVELVTEYFARCYDVQVDPLSGYARWHRIALPGPGGVGDQDSRLLRGLEYAAVVANQLIDEQRKRDHAKKVKTKRKKQLPDG